MGSGAPTLYCSLGGALLKESAILELGKLMECGVPTLYRAGVASPAHAGLPFSYLR